MKKHLLAGTAKKKHRPLRSYYRGASGALLVETPGRRFRNRCCWSISEVFSWFAYQVNKKCGLTLHVFCCITGELFFFFFCHTSLGLFVVVVVVLYCSNCLSNIKQLQDTRIHCCVLRVLIAGCFHCTACCFPCIYTYLPVYVVSRLCL